MPCFNVDDYCEYDDHSMRKNDNHIAQLESLLCSASRVLERLEFDFDENPELSRWWNNHKKEDERRLAAELKEKMAKEHAFDIAKTRTIASLNSEEHALLKKFNLL